MGRRMRIDWDKLTRLLAEQGIGIDPLERELGLSSSAIQHALERRGTLPLDVADAIAVKLGTHLSCFAREVLTQRDYLLVLLYQTGPATVPKLRHAGMSRPWALPAMKNVRSLMTRLRQAGLVTHDGGTGLITRWRLTREGRMQAEAVLAELSHDSCYTETTRKEVVT